MDVFQPSFTVLTSLHPFLDLLRSTDLSIQYLINLCIEELLYFPLNFTVQNTVVYSRISEPVLGLGE